MAILLITPFILLNNNKVQNWIADKISQLIHEQTGGKIEIEDISLQFFNKLKLQNVLIEDPDGEKVASIGSVYVHVGILPLLHKELIIREVEIDNFDGFLRMDTAGNLNISFLTNAFSSETPKAVPNMKFPIITLNNASFRYVNLANDTNLIDGVMNMNNVSVQALNMRASFAIRNNNDIAAEIAYLNMNERSGLKIIDFNTKAVISDSIWSVPHIQIKMPETDFTVDSIYAKIYRQDGKIAWDRTEFNLHIPQTRIFLPDLKYVVPQLTNMNKNTFISADITGRMDNLKAKNLQVRYGNRLSVKMNMDANGLPNINKTFFYCNISHIRFDKASVQDLIANITSKPFVLPQETENLGLCQYSGNISGFLSNLVLYGNLKTDIGNVKTDISVQTDKNFSQFKINGKIESPNLQLGKVLPKSGLGDMGFSSTSEIILGKHISFSDVTRLNISHLTFREHRYRNIAINGAIKKDQFAGKIEIDDPDGYFNFTGIASNINDYKSFEFNSTVKKLNLNKLNLIKSYPDLEISMTLTSDFEGDKWENMAGFMNIDSLRLQNGEKEFVMEKFYLNAENGEKTSASLESDLINGGLSGQYSLSTLYFSLIKTVAKQIPIIENFIDIKDTDTENNITFSFEVEPLKKAFTVLDIPWFTTQRSTLYLHINTEKDNIRAKITVPQISNGTTDIDSINIAGDNISGINIAANAIVGLKAGHLNTGININGKNDTITTIVNWNNSLQHLFAGEIAARTHLSMTDDNSSLIALVEMLPTEMILHDKLWIMNRSMIWSDMKSVEINDFGMQSSDEQTLKIDGKISELKDDGLTVSLNDISLDYISELLPEKTAISFGGKVSGYASVSNLMQQPEITADVISERFMFNNSYFGQAHATCSFDTDNTSLKFGALITDDDKVQTAELSGNYFFGNDSLDIKALANGLDIKFIDYYIADVFGRVTGYAYGDVHIHGITKSQKVAVDVNAFAKDASISVDFLKNRFFFSDSIKVSSRIIDFGTIDITDVEGHKGTLSGHIGHEYFKNITLDLSVGVDNMQILNTTKADNESFYGTAYGTGNVIIRGDDRKINISCKATTNAGTRVYIPIDSYYASENSFITFMDTQSTEKAAALANKEETSSTNLILDIMLDVTPDAEVQILIDSKTGDMLRAAGSGSLRITYDIGANDMKLYGAYQIDQGAYLFTFQSLLRKEFKIKEGSSIIWSGDLMNAIIDIDAYYQLTADLAEILDESVLSNTGRTSVPVQCLLNLSGSLMQPTIKFDIKLPNSDEELNRALQNTVNTEEHMNRQIIGLLLLGKFLNNENTATNALISQNELFSVVSSTLSSQLNNWASQMFDNWGFGVNFRTIGEGETRSNEYEFNFQYTPNNRIVINGNVGYRDDAMSSNPFIGDFDFEYKLIQSGKLKAKAYTHTNDYREFKKGLTTQGVGLVYSESFNNLTELWQTWKSNAQKSKQERAVRKEKRKARKEEKRLKREIKKNETVNAKSKNAPTYNEDGR